MTSSDPKYQHRKTGVIFVNFGSPESLDYFSIRRFLKHLLLDRRVVSLPRLIWLPILYGFILPTNFFSLFFNIRSKVFNPLNFGKREG